MTIEDQIRDLLAKAEPLRSLPDDEPAKVPLTAIVDEINALRAIQAADAAECPADDSAIEGDDAADSEGRKPGRPKKAD